MGQSVSALPCPLFACPDPDRQAAAAGLTPVQAWLLVVIITLAGCLWLTGSLWSVLRIGLGSGILVISTVRLVACAVPRQDAMPAAPIPDERVWPVYTVILALYREAAIVPQLIAAMEALDYPRDRLQIIAAVEADDVATVAACWRVGRHLGLQLAFAEGHAPRTKPRALNAALAMARGDLLVVYDAEDRPHPRQLREAATGFARGGGDLAVLQSPLRVSVAPQALEIARQFRLEYAALFEVILPFLTRLGLPFPLGGTSNHIRRSVLEALGGWDPWNVTEDADLGFRLAAAGYRAGMLRLPTMESATPSVRPWLAQRSRWLKGHMQTVGVHSRNPAVLGWRGTVSLILSLGCGIGAAGVHGPMTLLLILVPLGGGTLAPGDLLVLGLGWGSAVISMAVGARRTGTGIPWTSLGLAAAFWPLQSLALVRALWQLRVCPHHWDKTDHAPEPARRTGEPPLLPVLPPLDEVAESGLSGSGEHQPPPPRRRRDDPAHPALG